MDEERAPTRKQLAVTAFIGALAAVLVGLAAPNPVVDAVVNRAVAEEVTARACIAQYEAGERWIKGAKKPACSLGTHDVPATAMKYPGVTTSFWTEPK
jgi:hypothetical protein